MFPKEYIEFLVHFHGDRDYFECHEILEEYWKTSTPQDKSSIWVGFILLSVSLYHHRRQNFSGALRTIEKAIHIFLTKADQLERLGINQEQFLSLIRSRREEIEAGQCYQSMNLPIIDQNLTNQCFSLCQEKGIIWGTQSDLANEALIHRHSQRDRTSVILERNFALEKRKKNRSDS
ncbi:DUF309 domain-containing protein [Cytobacillus sp. Hz8]|uniref:DUF309 domain-containing protein n=1 Tax=Cytobacillus sp. Hz8 TaxID=3347168 RepID=UPI0035D97457